MFRIIPEYYHNLSLRLSEVLDDIGVNVRTVKKRRRLALLHETLVSVSSGRSFYIFGSSSEGTTTFGLNSDSDVLQSLTNCNVIQDYAEWKPGVVNLLMIKDDGTSPGYCHLQLIRPDMPLPHTDILYHHCCRDAHGRILLKNTVVDALYNRGFMNGPARTDERPPGFTPIDRVIAMPCESWPKEARDWSQRCLGKWPTEDMKRYVENSGCFVVPVDSKLSQIETLEWRISTSKAERCLMFNLNKTQIQCFVLLKMILKTYLKQSISSYMCKTVLLRCIEKTHCNIWTDDNLLKSLTVCLQELYCFILHKKCPHYFIPDNNLMARKITTGMKDKLMKSLRNILESQGAALYGIQTDHLSERLQIKMNPLYQSVQSAPLYSACDISLNLSGNIAFSIAYDLGTSLLITAAVNLRNPRTVSDILMQATLNFLRLYRKGTKTKRKTLQLFVPFLCSSLGSVLASVNMETIDFLSPEALNWLSAGLNSDVSSGRLKLASVLHCAGDMLRAESVLKETERLYRLDSVQPVCGCYPFTRESNMKREYCRVCDIQNEKAIKSVHAFCIRFFPAEMNCMPRELQYELFRSTEEERLHRDKYKDSWMNMAVVDSLPFLFFLQYRTYRNLQSYNDQQRALGKLALTVSFVEDFGHRETALNLLGQCYEQENRLNDALACYTRSLNVRGTNNVAKVHLCRLLADMQNNLQSDH